MKPRAARIVLTLLGLSLLAACSAPKPTAQGVTVTDAAGKNVTVTDGSRIVSVGTSLTESLVALGLAPRLVGVDNAGAEYIGDVSNLPKVGPRNGLSPEGVLSLKPTLVVATSDAGPPAAIDQIRGAGVTVLALPSDYTMDKVKEKIRTLARCLDVTEKGERVVADLDRDLTDAAAVVAKAASKPKVLFVGRGPNMPNATMSGRGTTIDEMIRLAGGVNPMTDFQGFREMTDEAVVAAQPDIILMTQKSFERSGGIDGVLKFPGVALTPAGKNRRILAVSDMYFQGFGPGAGRAVRDLARQIHPELAATGEKSVTGGPK